MNRCERCGREIQVGEESLDLWAFNTQYYEDDDVKTMKEPDDMHHDYIIIGESCCGQWIRSAWRDFVAVVIMTGGEQK